MCTSVEVLWQMVIILKNLRCSPEKVQSVISLHGSVSKSKTVRPAHNNAHTVWQTVNQNTVGNQWTFWNQDHTLKANTWKDTCENDLQEWMIIAGAYEPEEQSHLCLSCSLKGKHGGGFGQRQNRTVTQCIGCFINPWLLQLKRWTIWLFFGKRGWLVLKSWKWEHFLEMCVGRCISEDISRNCSPSYFKCSW